MSGSEALKMIREMINHVDEAAKGKTYKRAEDAMKKKALELANDSWRKRTSPDGKAWNGTRGPVTLGGMGGALQRTLRVEDTANGFKVTVDGKSFGRHTMAGVQQYGGLTTSGFKGKTRGGAKARHALANKGSKRGLMTYRTPSGWKRTYFTVHHGNKMLPWHTEVPTSWTSALRAAAESALIGGR
jgi:hypothetical protein